MITFPLSFPASPAPSSVSPTLSNIVGVATSPFTAEAQVQEWPGEFLGFSVSYPPMVRAKAEPFLAVLSALRGASGTVLFGDATAATPLGVATGTPLVNALHTAGYKTLNTDGWTPSVNGILKAGDYISILDFNGVRRLHKVLTDANSNSSGAALLDIFPRLRTDTADNTAITVTATKGTFRLANNQRKWSVNNANIYTISFELVEAL
jgi:hypothetical protein